MIGILLIDILGLLFFFAIDRWVVKVPKKELKRLEVVRLIGTIFVMPSIYYGINQSFLYSEAIHWQNFSLILGLFFLVNLGVFCFNRKINPTKKWAKTIAKIVFIVLVLECSLFNYKHYLSLTRDEVVIDSGIEIQNKEGQVLTQKTEDEVKVKKVKLVEAKIKTEGIPVHGFYVDAYDKENKLLTYTVSILDKASGEKIRLNETNSYYKIPSSFYKNVYNPYESDYLYLTFTTKDTVHVREVILNPVVPIFFSMLRVTILSSFLIFCYLIRPSSSLFQKKVSDHKKLVKKGTIAFAILVILFSLGLTNWSRTFRGNRYFTYSYFLAKPVNVYQELAEALAHGQVFLLSEPTKVLEQLENPYNIDDREDTLEREKEEYFWDTAYYQGRYYVYYGIVPVVLTYLPFYLLTGHHIANNFVIFFGLVGIILGLLSFLRKMVDRYGQSISVGTYLYILLIAFFGSHFVFWYAAKRPDFYSIPVVWGVMFSLFGMNCWFNAKKSGESIDKKWLLLGSFMMALVAGCRPQLLLISFTAIPIFWEYFMNKKVSTKEKAKKFLVFILPYLAVAVLLMIYNYIRFDSVFDFGANYNLTTNDMTKRGFHFERIGLGLYYFLFAIPGFQNVFPFVKMLPLSTSYIGITIYESMFGGVLVMMPLFFLGLFFFRFKKIFKDKIPYVLSGIFTVSALVIIVLDTNMAGILPRYCLDFTWLFVLSTSIVLIHLIEHWKGKKEYLAITNRILYGIVIFSIVYNFFLLFIDVSYSYKVTLPTFFYTLYYLFQFYL